MRSQTVRENRIDAPVCSPTFTDLEVPNLCETDCDTSSPLSTAPPPTVSTYQQLEPWMLTLEEAVDLSLRNSRVLQKIGGVVVNSPQGASTIYDPAIQNTDPNRGTEAALSAFDAQFSSNLSVGYSEQKFNNLFFGAGANQLTSNSGIYTGTLSKTSSTGTVLSFGNTINYARNDSVANRFPSTYETLYTAQIRQPLTQGFGTDINRIAGTSRQIGIYNGVTIARINNDISVVDFEIAIRNLIRDVERNYWELVFAYRDLDAKLTARDSARKVWENRKARLDNGVGRPDDEAQARQQYYSFQNQIENALSGQTNGLLGVFGTERELRRLLGLPTADGKLIRPITEPVVSGIHFDWGAAQEAAIDRRAELRRQKWTVKQRELELYAARNLNRWRLDLVADYGWRGFGDDLFGNRGVPEGSAYADLSTGQLDQWNVGIEFGGPIGNRLGHVATKNAELRLTREKAILVEQQRQILHDLNTAYSEVDRAYAAIKSIHNNRIAVLEELEPKRRRAEAGEDQIFFLLDVQQRAATAQSNFHRAVVDYNIALLNFAYASGKMLDHYRISLSEAPWENGAQARSDAKIRNFKYGEPNHNLRDMAPLSRGKFPQSTESGMTFSTSGTAIPESRLKPETEMENQSENPSDFAPQVDPAMSDTPLGAMNYSSQTTIFPTITPSNRQGNSANTNNRSNPSSTSVAGYQNGLPSYLSTAGNATAGQSVRTSPSVEQELVAVEKTAARIFPKSQQVSGNSSLPPTKQKSEPRVWNAHY